jgi:hypothetical protein
MKESQMRGANLVWGGLALAGLGALFALPKALPKARMAARKVTGVTYKTGGGDKDVRATADPARGYPA